jgi:hypothetical protein
LRYRTINARIEILKQPARERTLPAIAKGEPMMALARCFSVSEDPVSATGRQPVLAGFDNSFGLCLSFLYPFALPVVSRDNGTK